jgi:dihydrofolate reductase
MQLRFSVFIATSLDGFIARANDCTLVPCRKLVSLLEDRGARQAYVDGGQLIQSFMAAGLVTDITVTRVPVLLGTTGRSLFGDAGRDIRLAHRATLAYPDGLVQSQYA